MSREDVVQLTKRHMLLGSGATVFELAMPNIARAVQRHLRLAHNFTVTSGVQAGAEAFAKALRQLSGNTLVVDIFPDSLAGNEVHTTKAIVDSALDVLITNVGPAAAFVKDVSLVELPYLFKDVANARAAFDGALGSHAAELLKAKGIFVAGWGELGLRHITANKPLRKPADLKDLRLCTQLSVPTLGAFSAMGAKAEVLPFQQLAEALRTGRFDGQENPIGIVIASNLNKVQSHLSLTGHVFTPMAFAVSNDVYDELNAAGKAAIVKAAAAGAKATRDYADNADKAGLAALKSAGMTIVEDVDRAAFRDAAEAAKSRLTDVYGAEALKRVTGYAHV